jgi:hypothetical protein
VSAYYSTFSMRRLSKLLDRAAGGSAEHRAIQEELQRRETNSPISTILSLPCGEQNSRINPLAMKKKKKGYGLEIKTFRGNDGASYLVFRTREGAFNVFVEVEAKEAARQCGATREATPRQMWGDIWAKAI